VGPRDSKALRSAASVVAVAACHTSVCRECLRA
jgi:hypothetical protein